MRSVNAKFYDEREDKKEDWFSSIIISILCIQSTLDRRISHLNRTRVFGFRHGMQQVEHEFAIVPCADRSVDSGEVVFVFRFKLLRYCASRAGLALQ